MDVSQDEEEMQIKAKIPVGESFGLASDLRSVTAGRGSYFLVDQMYEKLPTDLQQKIVAQIRQRKGLKVDDLIEKNDG